MLLCSFQKEESVLLDELLRIGDGRTPVKIVTIDTGVLFPETLATWRAFEQRYGVKIEVQDASRPEARADPGRARRTAARSPRWPRWSARWRARRVGSRASAASRDPRASRHELIEHDEQRGIWKYNPLAQWTEKDLWRRIHERRLPYNPLHDQGYASIGCAPCTQPGSGREGRWAGRDKTECGLHVIEPARESTEADERRSPTLS